MGVQLDTPPLPHPSGHIQGLHTHTHTLLAGHKGVPPPPSARTTGSRHTSKSLSHTPLNSLGQVGVQLDTPPLPHPSGHIQGLHTHPSRGFPLLLLRGLQHLDTPPNLSHTPLNSLGQVGVHTPPLPHPSGHTPSLHTPMSRLRESQEGCSPTTLFPSFYRKDSDSVGWTHTLGAHFSAQILG